MNRRSFLATLLGTLAAAAVPGQTSKPLVRIGEGWRRGYLTYRGIPVRYDQYAPENMMFALGEQWTPYTVGRA